MVTRGSQGQRPADRSDEGVGPVFRLSRSDAHDAFLASLMPAGVPGVALVAVGGYGRREMAPGSDLDVVLLHDAGLDRDRVGEIAQGIWYPVWDSGAKLDHSVRTVGEARELASAELAVAAGLLDARLIAGDAELVRAVRAAVFADWRREAPRRLAELRAEYEARFERQGELAYRLEGDLKEARGGLRDSVMLRFISASWLVDVPHGAPEAARAFLLDVRDALHLVSGRALDRLLLQEQDAVAAMLTRDKAAVATAETLDSGAGLGRTGPDGGAVGADLASVYTTDADQMLRRVAEAASTIAYAAESAWRQVDAALVARVPARQPVRRPLADGVVEQDGEVYLARAAAPGRDPVLVLRAAAAAAQAELVFAPHTVRRLAQESAPLPRPWPRPAREALVTLLGAGRGLIPVWEVLDRSGVLAGLLPEWGRIRSLPQRNSLHIHTVDRHTLETVVVASEQTRRVQRPDLLLVGALLHDIGKGLRGDHSVVGAAIAADLAAALGFKAEDVAILAGLVRHHLLLPDLATRRDPDDPATLAALLDALAELPCPRLEALRLLHALSEADSRATGPAAWNPWRAGLYQDLVLRAEAELLGFDAPVPEPADVRAEVLAARCLATPDRLLVEVEDASTVWVAAPDRIGVLAAAAGVLALRHLEIRAATTETVEGIAVQRWTIAAGWGSTISLPDTDSDFDADSDDDEGELDARAAASVLGQRLRGDLRAALEGTLDVAGRLASRDSGGLNRSRRLVAPPGVSVLEGASATATVLEVRSPDAPGLVHRITAALASIGVSARSARISTLGAEAVDVFYVVDASGRALASGEAARVADVVLKALDDRA